MESKRGRQKETNVWKQSTPGEASGNGRPRILLDLDAGTFDLLGAEFDDLDALGLAGAAALTAARNVFALATSGSPR